MIKTCIKPICEYESSGFNRKVPGITRLEVMVNNFRFQQKNKILDSERLYRQQFWGQNDYFLLPRRVQELHVDKFNSKHFTRTSFEPLTRKLERKKKLTRTSQHGTRVILLQRIFKEAIFRLSVPNSSMFLTP